MSFPHQKNNDHFTFNLNQSQTSEHVDICAINSKSALKNIPALKATFPRMMPMVNISPISFIPPLTLTPSTQSPRHSLLPSAASEIPSDNIEFDEIAFLSFHGYIKNRKLCDTLQGELYEGTQILSSPSVPRKVAIKKVDKSLHKQGISKAEHDMTYCVEENICKESEILRHITVSNRCTADYIVQFIDFIESDNAYYLIMEHIQSNTNLLQFVKQCFVYIKNGKLHRKKYNKVIKYIFWQIFTVVQWLHNDMQCCHLDLCLDNIMLEDADFILNDSDQTVSINPSISVKVCDFGRAELFRNKNFDCCKQFEVEYLSPQLYGDSTYDARSLDIWSLGIMLYHCCVGHPFFVNYNEYEYELLKHNNLKSYLTKKKIISNKLVDLLCDLLQRNEQKRAKIFHVLKHGCFKVYYQKYKNRIYTKSKQQKAQLVQQKETLNLLPYYGDDLSQETNVKRVFL